MHNNNCIVVAGCVNCNAHSTCLVDQDAEIIDPNTADVRCQCRGSGIIGDGLATGNNTCHLFKCDEYTGCAQVPCSTLSAIFFYFKSKSVPDKTAPRFIRYRDVATAAHRHHRAITFIMEIAHTLKFYQKDSQQV